MGDLFGDVYSQNLPGVVPNEDFLQREMMEYERETPPPSDSNPLSWWKERSGKYPYLAQLARCYLDAKPPVPTFTEEVAPKLQELGNEEPGISEVKEEQTEEMWTNSTKAQASIEDSDDGDALTRELIKTVQQLEDCRAAEESRGSQQTSAEEPKLPEEKTTTTLYRCHICNYIFTKKIVLTWHLKMHENKSKDGKGNFDCHICGKHIPCQSNLQNHMRVHTGERPYSCQYCGKGFKLKGHMTEHLRTHTGEKPFSCHICDKSFNRGSTLRKHVLAKHKEERPYRCEYCYELFTEKLLMKRHIRKLHSVKPQSPSQSLT